MSTAAKAEIREAVHEAAWPFLCRRILERTCPGYSAQPETMIHTIKMEFVDEHGITVTYGVSDYYDNLIAACRPFVTHDLAYQHCRHLCYQSIP